MKESVRFSAGHTHKKSLCVENAEANSERNLYNPPSGLVQSFHLMRKRRFYSATVTPFFVPQLKFNIETRHSQIKAGALALFFCGPIKAGTSVHKGKKQPPRDSTAGLNRTREKG
jgi:hypothetical protein